MNEEILRLKREFRKKWPFDKVAEIKRFLKIEGDLDVMEYLCDQVILECEIMKLVRGYSANMIAGPLLGSGCKKAFPWGRAVKSAKFTITATTNDGFETVSVKVESEGHSDLLTLRICACEYFMNMTAKLSNLSYDMALSQLCSGSRQYDNKVITLPGRA